MWLLRGFRACYGLAARVLSALMISWTAVCAQGVAIDAERAWLADYETGTVLYEKNGDQPFAPGNIVKVLTAVEIFSALNEGKITPETRYRISENTWRKGGGPAGKTAMFAELNSEVRVSDLLRGLIIPCGNDAALALAEGFAGSEQAFAEKLNERAAALGMDKTRVTTATGYDEDGQTTTARDAARLAVHIVRNLPEQFKMFSEPDFTWNKIRQSNRNPLTNVWAGADGFTAGMPQPGNGVLLGTGLEGGRRFIVVISGARDQRSAAQDARKLVEWGVKAFEAVVVFDAGEPIAELVTWGGEKRSVTAVAGKPVIMMAPRSGQGKVTAQVVYQGPVIAPVEKGRELGRVVVRIGGGGELEAPVYAGEDVGPGGTSDRAFDNIIEFFSRMLWKLSEGRG